LFQAQQNGEPKHGNDFWIRKIFSIHQKQLYFSRRWKSRNACGSCSKQKQTSCFLVRGYYYSAW
jgi:hypothetical protein